MPYLLPSIASSNICYQQYKASRLGAARVCHVEPAGGRARHRDRAAAQIVTAAIEVIAELGFARASFAQIARRAGLSGTELISYHLAGKERAASAADALAAYIAGNAEFVAAHRAEMRAMLEIFHARGHQL